MERRSRKSFSDFIPLIMIFLISAFIVTFICGIVSLENSVTVVNLDSVPPEISLKGDSSIKLTVGDTYQELGATATDNNQEVKVEISGNVNTNIPAKYVVLYTATDEIGNTAVVARLVEVAPKPYNGTIYLTFDDGVSNYTAELLDILAKYNVKATFFVTGAGSDEVLKREYNEGHAIGLHTLSHNYEYVYSSIDNFFADLYAVQDRIERVTGYKSYLMRFPGGSSNTVSTRYDGGQRIMSKLASEVGNRGFTYFDWNVSSGDASGASSSEQVYGRVIEALKYGGSSVVLQHDTKYFSIAAVESIIQYGFANGFEFKKLDASSFTAHHGINN